MFEKKFSFEIEILSSEPQKNFLKIDFQKFFLFVFVPRGFRVFNQFNGDGGIVADEAALRKILS
jgi:hypothetical protein